TEGGDSKHRANAGEGILPPHADVPTQHVGGSSGWSDYSEDHSDRRALAGSVRTEEADDLAASYLDVEAVDGGDRSESFDQLLGAEDDFVLLDDHGRSIGPQDRGLRRIHDIAILSAACWIWT